LRQAVHWYERAAAQGEAAAQYNLGHLVSLGQGVPQDLMQAHLWLSLAATGLPPGPQRTAAGQARDLLAAQFSPAQRAAAQARVQAWQPRREGPAPDLPEREPPARGAQP
jgi:TPR repeat protein